MALSRDLATSDTGRWKIVFVEDELHLDVQFVATEPSLSSPKWSVDDMLVRRPRDALQAQALVNLVSLIATAIGSDAELAVRIG